MKDHVCLQEQHLHIHLAAPSVSSVSIYVDIPGTGTGMLVLSSSLPHDATAAEVPKAQQKKLESD